MKWRALLESKGLEYHFLANIEPHIIISRKHPLLLQQKPVNLHTLAEYGFLWYLGQCDDYIYQLLSEGDQDAEKNALENHLSFQPRHPDVHDLDQ